jgi:hypothetical protein
MISLAWQRITRTQGWLDGLGIGLAGLCIVHCVTTTAIFAVLASAGGILLDPVIHEVGLMFAILFGTIALGKGLWDHGFIMPACIGALGIGVMAGALTLPHGDGEIFFTMAGVAILALSHDLNFRAQR